MSLCKGSRRYGFDVPSLIGVSPGNTIRMLLRYDRVCASGAIRDDASGFVGSLSRGDCRLIEVCEPWNGYLRKPAQEN